MSPLQRYKREVPALIIARKEQADRYREMRKSNPWVARLVYKRFREATKTVLDRFWNEPDETFQSFLDRPSCE